MKMYRQILFLLIYLWLPQTIAMPMNDYQSIKNVPYREINGITLHLDLYLPNTSRPHKGLIIWIHGGLWSMGSKDNVRLLSLTKTGYAIASIDYRLSGTAPYPAQLEDIHFAIQWIKINGPQYGLKTDKIILAGESAGGHLAALSGLSITNQEHDASINSIIVYYGASNLNTILSQTTHTTYYLRKEALEKLLGGNIKAKVNLAAQASPIHYVDKHAPPLLIFHGVQDIQMPINQAHELVQTYLEHHRLVKFFVLNQVGHADKAFYNKKNMERVSDFLGNQ